MKDIPKLGSIITDNEIRRDAVHIAVVPVIASETLDPGVFIDLTTKNTAKETSTSLAIGIVDPFLTEPVEKGERFWMLLLPGTITSLRHEWTHPAFEDDRPSFAYTKKESEDWLRNFAATNDCPNYDTLIAAATGGRLNCYEGYEKHPAYRLSGEYLHFNGMDAHGEIPDEFWNHVENLTGRKMQVRPKEFSCMC